MRRNSEAVKTDVGRPMSSPHRQRVARNSEDLVTDVGHPLQMEEGLAIAKELVPASEKDPEQLDRLRQASHTLPLASVSEAVDANEKHFRTIKAEGA